MVHVEDQYYILFAIMRLLNNIERKGDCWIWTGCTNHHGYGCTSYQNKDWLAHRLSFLIIGKNILIPGLVINHICENRACINPNHLEQITNKENVLLGIGPTAINARKIVCIRGHPLTEDKIYRTKDDGRVCKKCHYENSKKRTRIRC